MAALALLHLLCVFGLFHEGLTALIQTQPTVTAAVGEEAHLRCQLMETRDVVQVTWQKLLPQRTETLASYTQQFGQRVNPAFRDKVQFTDAGLQNSSIVIMKVTEEDEGCYHCLFNSDPEGALTATTCLKVYELHEPVLHVRESNSAETVVSCSATGRPAPTVTLRVLRGNGHFSDYSSVSVTNSNATVTVTTTAVMTRFHDDSTEVVCTAQVLSSPLKETREMILKAKQSSDDGAHEKLSPHDSDSNLTVIITVVVVVAVGCVAVIGFVALWFRKRSNGLKPVDSEEIKTPQKPIANTHEIKTPLTQKVNEQVRLRLSTAKKERSDHQKALSPPGRSQRQLSF